MPFVPLENPNPKIVSIIASVLAVLVLAQLIWTNRDDSLVDKSAHGEMVVARALVITQPIGMMGPPPPTLKFAIPADPFRQLDRIGLDGFSLRYAAADLGVDITPVATLDLADIDVDRINSADRKCLTETIYHEARNQDLAGQMAVADVVLNRVGNKRYPNTICGVVYQGSKLSTGCQFTFTCDGSLDRPIERRAMVRSQILATAILGGFRLPMSAEATNYHAGYISPYWAPTLDRTTKIGDHIFYKRGANYDLYTREKAALSSG